MKARTKKKSKAAGQHRLPTIRKSPKKVKDSKDRSLTAVSTKKKNVLAFSSDQFFTLLKRVADELSGCTAIADPEGKIVFISSQLAEGFQLKTEALIGRPAAELAGEMLKTIESPMFRNYLIAWAKGDNVRGQEIIEIDKPELSVWQCLCGAWEDKPISGFRWILLRNITDIHGAEHVLAQAGRDLEKRKFDYEKRFQEIEQTRRELEQMKRDILEANRLKSEFLANMSHELRTPLNSILALSSILLARMDGDLNEEQEKQIVIIERSGKNLLRLINDILDLSKIEAGRMDLIVSEYDVRELIENIRLTVQPLIRESNLDFIVEVDPTIEVHSTDENKLKQILLNLLSNAIKFTPGGSVTLRVQPTKFNDVLEFSVIDTGIGIDSANFPKIFDPFRQVDGSATRKYGGTGLGLAITKKLVELLGGRLTLESELGKGSVFRFFIPSRRRGMENNILTEDEIHEMIRESRSGILNGDTRFDNDEPLDASKKTILLIDDDIEALYIMKKYISGEPFQVLMARTGEEGIAKAIQYHPDIITLDIMMPKKDGWSVLQELKSNPETRNIPVMIISIVDNKKLGFSLGAADYIVKPVVKDMLIKRLGKLCHEKRLKRILIVDDDLTQAELVEEILQSDDYLSEVATSGEMALQLVRRKPYDLIILDLLMPQVDGFAVLENLRHDPLSNQTPVLILTGKLLTREDQIKLEGKNYHLFLKSMFSRERLLGEIHSILSTNQ